MEMTITRALAELKLLDARINRSISNATFGGVKIGKKVPTGFNSIEEIKERAKADYQQAQDLIARRNKIKSAIVQSNATTKVDIAGKKMTVAEAIERKTSIEYDKNLLNKLRYSYASYVSQTDRVNATVQESLDEQLQILLGKDGKTSSQASEDISKAFKAENEATLIDPLDLKEKVETLEKEVEDFTFEVDFVLSESNTITRITIEE